MNKSLLMGAVSALSLAACGTMGVQGDGQSAAATLDDICKTKAVRCVEVVIQGGQITQVNDETFSGPDHLILWKLNPLTAPYTFPDNGIALKPTSAAAPANEFNCRPVFNRHLFVCSNRNTVARTYTYNVSLKDVAGNTITFDPKIINN